MVFTEFHKMAVTEGFSRSQPQRDSAIAFITVHWVICLNPIFRMLSYIQVGNS